MTIYKKNKQLEYVDIHYEGIETQGGLIRYAQGAIERRKNSNIHHGWTKDVVMNTIYSLGGVSNTEKLIIIYLYDLSSHQDVSPYIEINNRELSYSLGINEGDVSRIMNNLVNLGIIKRMKDLLDNNVILFNENITVWASSSNHRQESIIQRIRKRHASNNVEIHDMLRDEGVIE